MTTPQGIRWALAALLGPSLALPGYSQELLLESQRFPGTLSSSLGLGTQVLTIGDTNGDAQADFLVFGVEAHLPEAASLVCRSGSDGALLYQVAPALANERLDEEVGVIGDVNGDGVRDILVRGFRDQLVGMQIFLRVHSGATGSALYSVDYDPTWFPFSNGTSWGLGLSEVGDINADGIGLGGGRSL